MQDHDQILRFIVEDSPIRGQLVSLDASWRHILQRSGATGQARTILGHALSAVSLLASTLKIDGGITLQIRGSGVLHMLVVQATSQRTVRGIIRQADNDIPADTELAELFQSNSMVITIDTGKGRPHQGIVPLEGNSIAAALQAYFEQSEQFPTQLWLACDEQSASGLLIQKLPGESPDADLWPRMLQLADTVTASELLQLPSMTLLQRLFHEETLRVFESEPLRFACGCSRQRGEQIMQALGADEINSILQELGTVEINCEFCNASYRFDTVDVSQIFSPGISPATRKTRH
ncbi:MAG: Hsp33 family molecular chaperone HslO [Chromatiales bacterium]|jgi:molecular chaperone Hsp33